MHLNLNCCSSVRKIENILKYWKFMLNFINPPCQNEAGHGSGTGFDWRCPMHAMQCAGNQAVGPLLTSSLLINYELNFRPIISIKSYHYLMIKEISIIKQKSISLVSKHHCQTIRICIFSQAYIMVKQRNHAFGQGTVSSQRNCTFYWMASIVIPRNCT